jgi:AcrR family transcriptional regulator
MATIDLAAEQGLENITLNDVAERSGVGRPTIYRRWPSKEALLNDVVAWITHEHINLPPEGPIRDRLVDWFSRVIVGVQGPLRDLYEAFFHAERAELAPDAVEAASSRTEGMILAAMEAGELRADTNPHLLMQLMFGIIWYRATATGEPMDDAFAEAVVDGVLNGWLLPKRASKNPATAGGIAPARTPSRSKPAKKAASRTR